MGAGGGPVGAGVLNGDLDLGDIVLVLLDHQLIDALFIGETGQGQLVVPGIGQNGLVLGGKSLPGSLVIGQKIPPFGTPVQPRPAGGGGDLQEEVGVVGEPPLPQVLHGEHGAINPFVKVAQLMGLGLVDDRGNLPVRGGVPGQGHCGQVAGLPADQGDLCQGQGFQPGQGGLLPDRV